MEIEKLQENFMAKSKAKIFFYLGKNLKVLKKFEKKNELIISRNFSNGDVINCSAKYGNLNIFLKKEFMKKLGTEEGFDLESFYKFLEIHSFDFETLIMGCEEIQEEKALHLYFMNENGTIKKQLYLNTLEEGLDKLDFGSF